jgi:hypothetical protein
MGTTYSDLQQQAETICQAFNDHTTAVGSANIALKSAVAAVLQMGSSHKGSSLASTERLQFSEPRFDPSERCFRSSATLHLFPRGKAELAITAPFAYRLVHGKLTFAISGEQGDEHCAVDGGAPRFASVLVGAFEKQIEQLYSFG